MIFRSNIALLFAAVLLSCNGQKENKTETTQSSTEIPANSSGNITVTDTASTIPDQTATVNSREQSTANSTSATQKSETSGTKSSSSGASHQAETQKAVTKARTSTVTENAQTGKLGLTFLKEAEKKYFEERQMSIHFKRITEDSRCPAGVQCVWAGVAVAEITFDANEAEPQTVQLASNKGTGDRYQEYFYYNGFKISLKSVAPHAVQNKASLKGKYEIGLQFESAKNKNMDIDPAVIRSAPER